MLRQSITSAFWKQSTEATDRHVAIMAGRIPQAEISPDDERLTRVPEEEGLAIERIIGSTNAIDTSYLAKAIEVSKCVACLRIQDRLGRELGSATGVMVSPRLLLTAAHAVPSPQSAFLTTVWFDYERDMSGIPISPKIFRLYPDAFFYTNAELDFTLVAVEEIGHDGTMLSEYGFTDLLSDPVTAGRNEALTTIQHPMGGYKQVALRESKTLHATEDHLHLQADHRPASSGAPVFNDQWDLVALVHAGVYARSDQGQILTEDGKEWSPTDGSDFIKWAANEAVRASRISNALMDTEWTEDEALYLEELFEHELLDEDDPDYVDEDEFIEYEVVAEDPHNVPPEIPRHEPKPEYNPTPNEPEYTPPPTTPEDPHGNPPSESPVIPHAPEYTPPPPERAVAVAAEPVTHAVIESMEGTPMVPAFNLNPLLAKPIQKDFEDTVATLRDDAYLHLHGFDEKFLTTSIRFPRMVPSIKDLVARTKAGIEVLDYAHFSVVMNGRRKLPFFIAANIRKSNPIQPVDLWIYDGRISNAGQPNADFYTGGSLARELFIDPESVAWGQEASRAATDAHHFTNTTPIHADVVPAIWHSLEESIVSKTEKASLFTGPVFGESDPIVRGIRVPLEFWKLLSFTKPDGSLGVSAFKLAESTEPTQGRYAVYQVRVTELEQATKLDFGDLRSHDSLLAVDLSRKEVATGDDLVF